MSVEEQREIKHRIPMKAIYLYLFIAAVGLVLICKGPRGFSDHSLHRRVGPGRRIKLRSSFSVSHNNISSKHEPVAFDPLIAEIERRRDDKEWERHYLEQQQWQHKPAPAAESQPEWEEYMNAEDYVNDEDRFNVSYRLITLFPKVDVNPADGFLSLQELKDWHLAQALSEIMHRTDREMEKYDKNKDGLVSPQEYHPPSWVHDSGMHSFIIRQNRIVYHQMLFISTRNQTTDQLAKCRAFLLNWTSGIIRNDTARMPPSPHFTFFHQLNDLIKIITTIATK